jgi:hypothetical protein
MINSNLVKYVSRLKKILTFSLLVAAPDVGDLSVLRMCPRTFEKP